MAKNIKQDLGKKLLEELLEVIKDTKATAKKELPKVAKDLVTESVIHNSIDSIFYILLIIQVALPIYLFNTIVEPDYNDSFKTPNWVYIHLLLSSCIALAGGVGLIHSLPTLLVALKAPKAFLLQKINRMLRNDE